MVIDVHMETPTAAQAVIATTVPLEKGRTTSTAMTGTTGVIDPITTGGSSSNLKHGLVNFCLNIRELLCDTTGL